MLAGTGKRTVESILAQYKKNGQTLIETEPRPRGKPPFSLDDSLIPHIRHYVEEIAKTSSLFLVVIPQSHVVQAIAPFVK